MKLLSNIFKKKNSSDFTKTTGIRTESSKGLAVNKSSWYLTHTESINREFGFLISNFSFELIKNEFVGNEFWIIYSKKPINIEIWSNFGGLPFVQIRNTELPYDESKQLDNSDNIEDFNPKAKQIRQNWTKRIEPVQKNFLDEWLNNDNFDLSELNRNYEQIGKHEHKEYLRQAAITVRENLELKKGKMQNVF